MDKNHHEDTLNKNAQGLTIDADGLPMHKGGRPLREDGTPVLEDEPKEYLEHKRTTRFQAMEDIPPKKQMRFQFDGMAKASLLMLGVVAVIFIIAYFL